MPFTITPNMGLPVPAIGLEPAPDWGADLNQSLSLIDSHDHSPGNGAALSTSSLNINADLPFNNNSATSLKSLIFTPGGSPSSANGSLSESGVDLYYTDGNGNQIRITQSGSVSGATGSITGLVSPASASYVSGSKTFVWQSDTNKAASLDAASVIVRKVNTTSSPGITITAPTGLSSDYNLTLPIAPPSAVFAVVMDSSGNLSTNETTAIDSMEITNDLTITSGNVLINTGDLQVSAGDISANDILGVNVTASTAMYPSGMSNAKLTASSPIAIEISGGATARTIATGATFTAPIIMAGGVDSSGTINFGSGFSSSRTGTGQYTITYNGSVFDGVDTPIPVACCNTTGGTIATVTGLAVGSFQVRTTNSGGTPADRDFTFMVMGSRA